MLIQGDGFIRVAPDRKPSITTCHRLHCCKCIDSNRCAPTCCTRLILYAQLVSPWLHTNITTTGRRRSLFRNPSTHHVDPPLTCLASAYPWQAQGCQVSNESHGPPHQRRVDPRSHCLRRTLVLASAQTSSLWPYSCCDRQDLQRMR